MNHFTSRLIVPHWLTSHRLLLPRFTRAIQVLACCDPLDKSFESWPSKLTVFNYGIWFESNNIIRESEADRSREEAESFIDGKKWFIATYSTSGAPGGFLNGQVKLHNYGGTRKLLSSSHFGCLIKP